MTGATVDRPRLRIAYVLARPTGYSETFVDSEIRAVRATGAAVDVFPATEAGGGRAALLARVAARHPVRLVRGVRTLGFSYGARGWLAAATAIRLAPAVAAARPDIVHAHFVNLPTAIAVLVARDLGVPVTATAHAADFRLEKHRAALRRRLLALSHLFVISAAAAGQLAERGVPMTRVPHGVVRAAFDGVMAPRSRARGGSGTRLVTVARLVGKKGIDTAIEAVARLVAAGRGVTYDVYGDGPLRAPLERLAADRGVGAAVTFHGAVPHGTAVGALADADVAVLPCRSDAGGDLDGIPVFLMEAASRHVPVVTTAVSGIPELVDENSGRLVPPDDAVALAEAIEQVIDDPDRAAHRAELLAGRVAAEFSPELQAQRLLATWYRLARPSHRTVAPGRRRRRWT
ncbi:glycosyltransferase involved in cell wall biosynthesis [Catenuloplanes nepalensis]|uniref:Glycosyltransferase involved in cell wall biosynthesis n=1 Tax=Catenuloplanes nepalensis TaxID=587533 RepID=A0ABT9MXN7_9ACTN|nr:glycosyltransferase family 4 protein [Catenuloplanes nepalensis]MDP9796205.1 glycosyltransferase involved in cell wall biosynthesis [Catenuloplanes nepalensis]